MNFTSTCGPATAYFIYFQVLMFNSKTDVMPGMWGTGMMMAYERRMATGLQLLKPMIHRIHYIIPCLHLIFFHNKV